MLCNFKSLNFKKDLFSGPEIQKKCKTRIEISIDIYGGEYINKTPKLNRILFNR